MSVISVQGQANAAVVLKGLLREHGLPSLTPEGVDALSARFSTGLVLGHGVVSHDGKPLIDELRALFANAESKRLFTQQDDGTNDRPVGNLTAAMMAEVAASRKQARITDADLARYSGVTRQHMEERQRAAQLK
ncbi:hypothetical protein CWO91_26700 [Bradyrhizobium genosp. SA-3]|uniref:hypothetical protein n=1 Tax=Bradyrhizobium genosp. SA-3 TaxID=508868 RepID=UPI0010288780|nr:hypothetical protein [Bradyrhizobium genosp. SA-3]RZN07591.1 hypothetical protein CWO91_26700 [Bradyrhizobium genosp. SA-3]